MFTSKRSKLFSKEAAASAYAEKTGGRVEVLNPPLFWVIVKGKSGKVWQGHFQTKRAAEHQERLWLIERERVVVGLVTQPVKEVTAEDLLANYEQCLRDKGVSDNHRVHAPKMVRVFFEHQRIKTFSDITCDKVEKFRVFLRDKGLGLKTLDYYVGSLNSCLNQAIRLLDPLQGKQNPLDRLARKKLSRKPPYRPFLSRLHLARIISLLEQHCPEVVPIIKGLMFTGMRSGEACHLDWDDIENGFIHVRTKPDYHPKWYSDRAIPIIPEMQALLDSLPHRHSRVFVTPEGVPFRIDGVYQRLKRIVKMDPVLDKMDVDVHLLRHAFTTHLISSGYPPAMASAVLGHRDFKTTMGYLHLNPIHLKPGMEKLRFLEPSSRNEEEGRLSRISG